MGTLFRIGGGASFAANSAGFLAPVTDHLAGWFFLGGSQAETEQDRAGIANAVLSGSPSIQNGYVSFGGYSTGQFLTTAIQETKAITILCVARSTEAVHSSTDKPMFVSNFAGSGNGISLYVDSGTAPSGTLRVGASQNNNGTVQTQTSTTITSAKIDEWGFYVARLKDTGSDNTVANNERKIIGRTTGQSHTTNNYPRVIGSNVLRIGAGYTSNFNGSCDISFAAVFATDLTDAALETIYQSVKTRLLGKHGIVI